MKREIFKVQLSLMTGAPERQCLIYNKDRSVMVQGPADVEIELAMQGCWKLYFYGHVENEDVILEAIAPEQEW